MMFRPTSIALALAGLALASPAFAQDSDSETVNVGGQVAPLCILGTPSQTAIDLGQLVDVSGTRVGRLTTIANRTVSMPASFCNYANSAIRVDATALIGSDTSTPPTGFARAVNYGATVSGWAATDAAATTAATAAGTNPTTTATGGTQPAPKIADVTLTLNSFSVPSDVLLVAGNYSGQVVITLGPAPGSGL
jgi:hypothetical protein